jgi:hypothetical protein
VSTSGVEKLTGIKNNQEKNPNKSLFAILNLVRDDVPEGIGELKVCLYNCGSVIDSYALRFKHLNQF